MSLWWSLYASLTVRTLTFGGIFEHVCSWCSTSYVHVHVFNGSYLFFMLYEAYKVYVNMVES